MGSTFLVGQKLQDFASRPADVLDILFAAGGVGRVQPMCEPGLSCPFDEIERARILQRFESIVATPETVSAKESLSSADKRDDWAAYVVIPGIILAGIGWALFGPAGLAFLALPVLATVYHCCVSGPKLTRSSQDLRACYIRALNEGGLAKMQHAFPHFQIELLSLPSSKKDIIRIRKQGSIIPVAQTVLSSSPDIDF